MAELEAVKEGDLIRASLMNNVIGRINQIGNFKQVACGGWVFHPDDPSKPLKANKFNDKNIDIRYNNITYIVSFDGYKASQTKDAYFIQGTADYYDSYLVFSNQLILSGVSEEGIILRPLFHKQDLNEIGLIKEDRLLASFRFVSIMIYSFGT